MMNLSEIHKAILADAVIDIIKNYRVRLEEEPGMCDYRKEQAKLHAFDDIIANVEWYENKEMKL